MRGTMSAHCAAFASDDVNGKSSIQNQNNNSASLRSQPPPSYQNKLTKAGKSLTGVRKIGL